MRVNSSHPGKFSESSEDRQPYVTVTMTWEEARQYIEDYEDPVTKFRSDASIPHAIYAELKEKINE